MRNVSPKEIEMKKILAILIVLTTVFSLAACKKNKAKEYPPVQSTEEEARTVMTLSIDGKTYEVKYELYRAFFLTYKSQVDGGDPSVWTGENKAEYVERINAIILDNVTEIYAAFAICERIGFDAYSKDVENKIKENIRISVEGGSYGSTTVPGYASYDEYLAALKSANLNYSVQTLFLRYAIAVDAIDTYYIGTASTDDVNYDMTLGALQYTREDVKSFYDSENCVRVLRASFQKLVSGDPLATAEALKESLVAAADSEYTLEAKEKAVFDAIVKSGRFSNGAEIENGYVIGRYNLDRSYYGDMTSAAFSLEEGEVSEPISIVTNTEDTYYVIYRTYKSDAHFEANYDSIRYVYLMNYVGEITYSVADELAASVSYSDYLKNINHSEIGM